jgi:uncharacterized membrane protein
MVELTHRLFSKIPVVKTVYTVSRDLFAALFSEDGNKAFKEPVTVPFPFPPYLAVGFHAGETAPEIKDKLKEPVIPVFTPTAPHPISGFLLFVPKELVKPLDMSNEEVIKFLVSCGMLHPQTPPDES